MTTSVYPMKKHRSGAVVHHITLYRQYGMVSYTILYAQLLDEMIHLVFYAIAS